MLDLNVKNKWRYVEWESERYILLGLAASSQVAIDIFYYTTGFLITYKLMKIAREYNGIMFSMVLKLFIQRLLRLLPSLWFVFITTWLTLYYLA